MENKRILKSADRALELISILATNSTPLSASEIGEVLDINRTTAYGLINTLMEREFIERDSATNKYTIGSKLFELGSKYRFKIPFIPSADVVADTLAARWRLSVHVGIYQNIGKIIFILMHLPVDTVGIPVGYVAPAHCTAVGKILMANLPQNILDSHLDKMLLEKRTKNTIDDKIILKKELEICRERGYSKDNEEFLDGMVCIAAPIIDYTGKAVGAISISGPASTVNEKERELIEDIIASAKKISTEIGYSWGSKSL